MLQLFRAVASGSRRVNHRDRLNAIKGAALYIFIALVFALIGTAVAILLVGERDWLSPLLLTTGVTLFLLPLPLYILGSRLLSLDRQHRLLQQEAREDHLTGLFNRPYLLDMLERELSLSQRHSYVVSILLVELDDFAHILDVYGRHAGEKALRDFADKIREKVRESDLFGRFDGAQFLLVLPHTGFDDAVYMGEGLRAFTGDLLVRPDANDTNHSTNVPLKLTVNIGAASTENSGRNIQTLLNEADYALYETRKEHTGK